MTPAQHLWACAVEVERQKGDEAAIYATMQMEGLEADGDAGVTNDPGSN